MKIAKDQKILKKILKKYINNSDKILDVGCGVGRNLVLLNQLGYKNLIGTDISEEMVALSKKLGFNVVKIDDLEKINDKFDTILMSHVIEHVDENNLQSFFEKYLNLLNKDIKEEYVVFLTKSKFLFFFNGDNILCSNAILKLVLFVIKNLSQFSNKLRSFFLPNLSENFSQLLIVDLFLSDSKCFSQNILKLSSIF